MTVKYKYGEDKLLAEIAAYVDSTYARHYSGTDDVQAIDIAISGGMLNDFARASIIKYAYRFGKKDGENRKDLLKIIHYAMFMLNELDKKTKT